MRRRENCRCVCHSNPAVMHCVPCCVEPSPFLCEHANEVPQTCPCDEGCYCKFHTCSEETS